jgi:hypothetical protein
VGEGVVAALRSGTDAERGRVARLLAMVKAKFGLPPLDATTQTIRANLTELLARGWQSAQIESVTEWATAPHGMKGCPQSAASATDPLRFGQWVRTMATHAVQIELERKRRNR